MDAAVWGVIGVVVGGIITGYVSIRLETVRANKEAALDSAKRADDRRLGRDAFTRETLLALQDGLAEMNRVLIRFQVRHEGVALPADATAQYEALLFRLFVLNSRIADKTVRDSMEQHANQCGVITGAKNNATAVQGLGRAAELAGRITDRAGEMIRATYVDA